MGIGIGTHFFMKLGPNRDPIFYEIGTQGKFFRVNQAKSLGTLKNKKETKMFKKNVPIGTRVPN